MGLFNKLKEYQRMISRVERTIYGEKQEYLEIYEKNQLLEKEIEERTNELNVTNKRMLTLQHIWDMMNSSTPLESVLDKVVNSIHGELGYLHCAILRKAVDENGDYMQIMSETRNSSTYQEMLRENTTRLIYNRDGVFADAMNNRKIIQVKEVSETLKSVIPDTKSINLQFCHSIIIIPLCTMNKPFGWLCVFNSREELLEEYKVFPSPTIFNPFSDKSL